jgi:hypothetical protein
MIAQRSFLYTAVAAVMVLTGLTSCGDIEQNLVLKADGSGTLETTFDVGEMMSMVKGMGEMNSLTNEDVTISGGQPADTSLAKTEEEKDPMQLIIDKVTNPEYDRDFDTLISFVDMMPDSVKAKQTNLDLLKKINIRLKSPAKSSSLKMGLVMDFKNEAQLDEMIKYLESFDDSTSTEIIPSMGGGGMQSETFLSFDADMKAGWIRFDTVDYSSMGLEMGMSGDSTMSGEDMGMMDMMFGNTKLKSTIHVPGEVTSCTNKDAILTKDNKVIVEYSFLEVLKSGKLPGYTIYFTPKK